MAVDWQYLALLWWLVVCVHVSIRNVKHENMGSVPTL